MYRLAFLVHRAAEILECLTYLDVGLVDTEGRAAHLQMRSDAFIDSRGVPLGPAKHSRVIHLEPALTHHLFYVAIR